MSTHTYTNEPGGETSFELFRLSKSKEIVDVCPNTLRSYFKQGLPYYQRGKAIFVSKAELAAFIRRGAACQRFAAGNLGEVRSGRQFAMGGDPAFQPAIFAAAAHPVSNGVNWQVGNHCF